MKIKKITFLAVLSLAAELSLSLVNGPVKVSAADQTPKVVNLTTIDKDKINLYDNNGNKLNQNIAPDTNLVSSKKITKSNETYYEVGHNSWIKSGDVFKYRDEVNYISTYDGSTYKNLVVKDQHGKDDSNHDWYSDRTSYIKGEKYYRISTDKWVKATDAIPYKRIFNLISAEKNTLVYDQKGQVVRTLTKNVSLKSDRIAEINGIAMYRVAVNEWIIV